MKDRDKVQAVVYQALDERTQKLLRDCLKILGPPYPPRHHEPEAEWPRSKETKAADKLERFPFEAETGATIMIKRDSLGFEIETDDGPMAGCVSSYDEYTNIRSGPGSGGRSS